MATSKSKEAGAPANPIVPAPLAPTDDGGIAKFTWNVRGGNESLTIRCDTEDELKALRDKWKAVIAPPRRKLPYMHGGDECMVESCKGVMQTRTGTNRRTQQPYQFLRCSEHPKCNFTAYIETEENTPEDAPISPVAANALKNGANNEPAATAAASNAA